MRFAMAKFQITSCWSGGALASVQDVLCHALRSPIIKGGLEIFEIRC